MDSADTSRTGSSSSADASLVVGRVQPQKGMWEALEGVTNTQSVRNGVLIIFSKRVKGRIGIFCNRYVSGAIAESSGKTGMEALRELLSVRSGMFGFRIAEGEEASLLKQSLALDISELLLTDLAQRAGSCPAEALNELMAPGSQLLLAGDQIESGEAEQSPDPAAPLVPDVSTEPNTTEEDGENDGDIDSSYDWFADQMALTAESKSSFQSILRGALPGATPTKEKNESAESASAQPETGGIDLSSLAPPMNPAGLSSPLVKADQDKVNQDIERALSKGRSAADDKPVTAPAVKKTTAASSEQNSITPQPPPHIEPQADCGDDDPNATTGQIRQRLVAKRIGVEVGAALEPDSFTPGHKYVVVFGALALVSMIVLFVIGMQPKNKDSRPQQAVNVEAIQSEEPRPEPPSQPVEAPQTKPAPTPAPAATKQAPPVAAKPADRSAANREMIADAVQSLAPKKIPDSVPEQVQLGYRLLNNGEYEEAVKVLAETIKREPANVSARRYMAHSLLKSGATTAALAQFNALVSLKSLNNIDALAYGRALYASGKDRQAADLLTHFLASSPGDVAIRAELISINIAMGNGTRADSLYEEGLSLARTEEQRTVLDNAYTSSRRQRKQNDPAEPGT